jgi:methanogenic corrinoid protein MtbC1
MLVSIDFEATDLGTDAPPEQFVESARGKKTDILAMSCLVTTSMPDLGDVN